MANYTPQTPVVTGVAPVYNTAASSDTYDLQPGTKYLLHVKNGGGSSINVTPTDVASVSPVGASAFTPSPVIAVTNAQERLILLDANRFRDPTTGKVTVAFSATASVTHAMWAQQ